MNVIQTKTRRWALLVGGLGLAVASCGAGESLGDTTTSFDSSVFVGTFNIVDVTTNGVDVPLSGQPTIEIDDVAASVSADTGCNTHLGSYSFFEDGTVSITLTGGTRRDCEASTQLQEDSITKVLKQVNSWTSSSSASITLSTPDDDMVGLQRR